MMPRASGDGRSLTADILAGALAGAVSVWVMDRVTWDMYLSEDEQAFRQEKMAQVEGKYAAHEAVAKVARAVGVDLSPEQEWRAGKVVHYMMGVMPGAIYGAMRRRMDAVRAGRGLLYGLALFVVVDEGVAPAMGLASGPRAYPWQAHARGLVGHLVLGAVTEALCGALDDLADAIGQEEDRRFEAPCPIATTSSDAFQLHETH